MHSFGMFGLMALALGFSTSARATTYTTQDFFGSDLILLDGDVLSGALTNIGTFEIPLGATVLVDPGIVLEVSAATIVILGDLDGVGAGALGGLGGPPGAVDGSIGAGPGGGGGGSGGPCVHGGGGAGGSYGGLGGRGGTFNGVGSMPNPGPIYGTDIGLDFEMGSGGGGGGSGCDNDGGLGGNGGAAIALTATVDVTIDGNVVSGGGDGQQGGLYSGGGGGGSGGSILVDSPVLLGVGMLVANGGDGGENHGPGGISCGGAGGGGGRIKLIPPDPTTLTLSLSGGAFSLCEAGWNIIESDNGQEGENNFPRDEDLDGITDLEDNCPTVENADQLDSDLDGRGDECDDCPGFDDTLDGDEDGFPDDCDNCPLEPQPNQRDEDGDGWGFMCECDDLEPLVYPEADEICDGLDNDCDEDIDEEATDAQTWYYDSDFDQEGDAFNSITSCDQPNGYTLDGSDCNDGDPAINTLAIEVCDDVDNDCDGDVDEDLADCATNPDAVDKADTGCSCSVGSTPASLGWLALLVLAVTRRRQASSRS